MTDKDHQISFEISAFLTDCRARHLAEGTVERYYKFNLGLFQNYLISIQVFSMEQITTEVLRGFLAWHASGHSAGGSHCVWRAVKAFINWFEREMEGAWTSPILKRMGPKQVSKPIPGVSPEVLKKLLATCDRSLLGRRDRALLLFLFDTGLRRQEMVDINLEDLNLDSGEVRVRHGKGDRERSVYIGATTTRELLRYLRERGTGPVRAPLWLTRDGSRITPAGLRQVLRRRAQAAGVAEVPSPHDFRRGFALQCLRNEMDPFTLRRLMGHTTLKVLQVYLDQSQGDLLHSHKRHGPVDNL